jgi:hypothetical protein
MEIFKNKFWVKLIASICLILTLLNFGGASKVYAEEEEIWGSVLLKPIISLLTGIGDSVMEILHSSIQEQRQAIIKLDGSEKSASAWALFGAIVIGVLAAVAFIAACVVTGGAIAAAAAAIGVTATFTISLRNDSSRCSYWNYSGSKYI